MDELMQQLMFAYSNWIEEHGVEYVVMPNGEIIKTYKEVELKVEKREDGEYWLAGFVKPQSNAHNTL